VEDWALIRRLHLAEGESMRSIAARLGISRNTVAKAVCSEGPPTYVRAPQDSGIKAVEPSIRALLLENPRMPATVLAERVGWAWVCGLVPGERCQDPARVCPG
jgi:transcriptional regulator with XRE-family HTH domain